MYGGENDVLDEENEQLDIMLLKTMAAPFTELSNEYVITDSLYDSGPSKTPTEPDPPPPASPKNPNQSLSSNSRNSTSLPASPKSSTNQKKEKNG